MNGLSIVCPETPLKCLEIGVALPQSITLTEYEFKKAKGWERL